MPETKAHQIRVRVRMTSLSGNEPKIVNIGRQRSESLQSSQLDVVTDQTSRHRGFSFTEMLGRRTSLGDAFKRDSRFMTNGDGFERSNYMKGDVASSEPSKMEANLSNVVIHQDRVLLNLDSVKVKDPTRGE